MELKEPPDPAQQELLPVVRFAVARKVEVGRPDYWDHATLLELAVLARNLRLIREARAGRGEETAWIEDLEHALVEARSS
jgi:hypothetical protein